MPVCLVHAALGSGGERSVGTGSLGIVVYGVSCEGERKLQPPPTDRTPSAERVIIIIIAVA